MPILVFVHECQNVLAPTEYLICSKDSQNVNDHGAILIHIGKNPL